MSDAIKGNILTSAGWVRGEITFGVRIAAIQGSSVDPSQNEDVYILPGFIDLHVHGGGGKDVMEGGDAVHTIASMQSTAPPACWPPR
jgi:N-acetylglucosamine-6-phosphate deacetylase